jgi:hypothetical protein
LSRKLLSQLVANREAVDEEESVSSRAPRETRELLAIAEKVGV